MKRASSFSNLDGPASYEKDLAAESNNSTSDRTYGTATSPPSRRGQAFVLEKELGLPNLLQLTD